MSAIWTFHPPQIPSDVFGIGGGFAISTGMDNNRPARSFWLFFLIYLLPGLLPAQELTVEQKLEALMQGRSGQLQLFREDQPIQVIRPEMFHPERGRDYYSEDPDHKGYLDLNPGVDEDLIHQLGGDWGSSGGDGVLCYSSSSELKAAEKELGERGYLSKSTIRSAKSAYALEVFEYLSGTENFKSAEQELTSKANDLIATHERSVSKGIPAVGNHLKALEHLYPVENWIPAQPVDVPDSEFHVSEFGATEEQEKNQQWQELLENRNCHLVQTVLRVSQRSVDGRRPKGWFFYNPYIYHEKFDDLSRYVMKFHEYLYFMMTTTGHRDSYWVRKAIKELLFDDVSSNKRQNIFWYILGDYQILWSKTLMDIASLPENQSLMSTRFYSDYVKMVETIRDTGISCSEGAKNMGFSKNELKRFCTYTAVEETDYSEIMTSTQAFFFVTHFYLQQITRQMNAAALGTFDQQNPKAWEDHWKGTARTACALMPNLLRGTVEGDVRHNNFTYALKFCEEFDGQLQ